MYSGEGWQGNTHQLDNIPGCWQGQCLLISNNHFLFGTCIYQPLLNMYGTVGTIKLCYARWSQSNTFDITHSLAELHNASPCFTLLCSVLSSCWLHSNFILNSLQIADFGLSNFYGGNDLLTTYCGSPLYASPEIVNGVPYIGPEVRNIHIEVFSRRLFE